jgi:FAD/FMN-containing dehydrogenase
VGVAKAAHLHLVRSEAEVQAMRAIKTALDPTNVLNPGAVLTTEPTTNYQPTSKSTK